jgi:hypothetical protein
MVPGHSGSPSLAALLHIGTDEVLGVLLKDVVDFIKDCIHILAELLSPFLPGWRTISRLIVSAAALALDLLLGHLASRTEVVC